MLAGGSSTALSHQNSIFAYVLDGSIEKKVAPGKSAEAALPNGC